MRIAVNTRLLVKNKLEGIGWFTYENLKRITSNHKEHDFYFIFDRKHDQEFLFSDNITPLEIFPQARHPFLYYCWFEHSIPRALKKINADVFISPDGYLSLKTNVPSVNVFHDLNFEHYPKDVPFLERRYYKHYFPKYARKAERIATVSEYSKNDIVKNYKITPEKIDVVYNGANENYKPLEKEIIETARNKYSSGKPYFVFIGALHPRKNLDNLFNAFNQFRSNTDKDIKLLLVGEKMWWTNQIKEAYERSNFRNDIIFTGRLGINDLTQVLGAALALTYVSYFEGFGIPIVEAFKCNVPVITSNITSMPEVAGDAALLVDPFDKSTIASAMQKIADDGNLRKQLTENGRKRKDIFTWDKSAERLWNTIENVIKEIK